MGWSERWKDFRFRAGGKVAAGNFAGCCRDFVQAQLEQNPGGAWQTDFAPAKAAPGPQAQPKSFWGAFFQKGAICGAF